MCNIAFFVDITNYYVEYYHGFILLRLQVQAILVDRLLLHFTVQHAGLHEFTTRTQLLHRFRLVELLLELLQGTFDVVALFDLNAEHDSLNWAPKIRQFVETSTQPLSNSRLMTSFWISLVPSPMVQSLLSR